MNAVFSVRRRARPRWPTDRPAGRVGRGDSLLRRDAFQRACVTLACKRGDLLVGRVGNHGVTLLAHHAGNAVPHRTSLIDVAGQIARTRTKVLASTSHRHRSGQELRVAACSLPSCTLGRRKGGLPGPRGWIRRVAIRIEHGAPVESSKRPRQERRRRPELLSPRFDRYIEVVLAHSGYRLDAVKTHCVGFRAVGRLSSGWRVFGSQSSPIFAHRWSPPKEARARLQISSPRTAGLVSEIAACSGAL